MDVGKFGTLTTKTSTYCLLQSTQGVPD